jgi:hypothetical protein
MGVHHSVIDRLIQRLQETVNVDERPRSGRLHVSMLPDSNVTITVGIFVIGNESISHAIVFLTVDGRVRVWKHGNTTSHMSSIGFISGDMTGN